MIIVANVLSMNGGTTFILRMCKEMARQGREMCVLVLFDDADEDMEREIEKYAKVVRLWRYTRAPFANRIPSRALFFLPLDTEALLADLAPYGPHLHVMGVFGLLFASRLSAEEPQLTLSAGIYHQNEFMFLTTGSFFERTAQALFRDLPPTSVIFFNELPAQHYSQFFNKSYECSKLLPIGIDLPETVSPADGDRPRLVSIGNLVDFKTYNQHIIEIVAQIRPRFPDIHYDIYGSGANEIRLSQLVVDLGVKDSVTFHGTIPYETFEAAVRGARVFIGSGTAIVEAAALGIPAVIGIESQKEPVTYGLIADVPGFSYNENSENLPKMSIAPLIERLLQDDAFWGEARQRCLAKAQLFSISHTASGFADVAAQSTPIRSAIRLHHWIALSLSVFWSAAKHVLGDKRFAARRNQSYAR